MSRVGRCYSNIAIDNKVIIKIEQETQLSLRHRASAANYTGG